MAIQRGIGLVMCGSEFQQAARVAAHQLLAILVTQRNFLSQFVPN